MEKIVGPISLKQLKQIPEEKIHNYLGNLMWQLQNLVRVLKREEDEIAIPYVETWQSTLEGLALKHSLVGQDRISFSLTIVPENSGFPTVSDIYLLQQDKEEAEKSLKEFPEREDIIENIRDAILRKASIVRAQTVLRRHSFYTFVKNAGLINSYELKRPSGGEVDGKRWFTLEWNCIETDTQLPVFYKMSLTQDMKYSAFDKTPNDLLETNLYRDTFHLGGQTNLQVLVRTIDNEIEEIHPQMIEKYTLGPFYDNNTENSEEVKKIFEGIENPSMLKFKKESVVTQGQRNHGNCWDKIRGRKTKREIFGPVDSQSKIIVPFRIRQRIGNSDEYGNSCQVYGITRDGEVMTNTGGYW